jgi:hypothetical protein
MNEPSKACATHLAFTVYDMPAESVFEEHHSLYTGIVVMGAIARLQQEVPALAGEFTEASGIALKNYLDELIGGNPYTTGQLVLSCWHYSSYASGGCFEIGLRIVCLDPAQPISIEMLRVADSTDGDGSLSSLCVSVSGRSDADCLEHPVLRALLAFFGVSQEALDEALNTSARNHESGLHEYSTPGAHLMMHLFDEPVRVDDAVQEAERALRDHLAKQTDQALQSGKREKRQYLRQLESLNQQLATARAIAERQRTLASAAEKALNAIKRSEKEAGSGAGDDDTERGNQELEPDPAGRELEKRLEVANTTNLQLRGELDEARDEIYRLRLRIPASQDGGTQVGAGSWDAATAPESFGAIEGWLAQWIPPERLFVHPKAIRAARKSVFADPGLVYRVLHALAEHYWPMKMRGDEAAARRWSAFLDKERLTCGLTGAAVSSHRTIDSYQIQFGKRRFPMDMHIQGSSSRKEQDGLRVYFHASKELGRILVGHFPTHLANRQS